MKVEIKNRLTNAVIYATEVPDGSDFPIRDALTEAARKGANITRANLDGANLTVASLYGASLYGAGLGGANLTGANLTRANLDGAGLGGANLGGANLTGANLTRANLTRANLTRANLDGASLYGASLYGAKLPAPTMLLLASWGDVSDDLCADLMLFDAANHPDPTAFDRWAAGGPCPYADILVERAANFTERHDLWGKGELCRPYDLTARLLAEKCPEWSDERRAEFEARFKKGESK